MLHLSGYSAGDIQFRTNSNTRLTNLTGMVGITGVHCGTRGSDFAAEYGSKFKQQVEILSRTDAISSRDNYRSAFDVDFAFFEMTLDYRNDEILVFDIFIDVHDFRFAGFCIREFFLAHHAFAHRRHLRTMVGVDDCRNDISSESGTYL